MKPYYYVRIDKVYDSIIDAEKLAAKSNQFMPLNFEVGYYMPQPIYKSWIPNWFIRFITKKQ